MMSGKLNASDMTNPSLMTSLAIVGLRLIRMLPTTYIQIHKHIILEEDPRAPRRHLFSDGQNIYDELRQQFRRANYIASVWNNASAKMINILNPENYRWTLEDDKYHFHWFDGDQLPDFVSQSLEEELAKKPEENTDEQDDDLDIQYQDRIDDELPDFNDDDNED
ncbi:hypothetical protein HW555_009819 [Spodoptera exigua]|uniref:Uncharacterized protein n=1 Tax=Spodoptera exigua TaxID=7107 RepID=A0A835L6E9_SPOEX|nr:hypothetical protein HW555_009819 [Spodoptera exigua]